MFTRSFTPEIASYARKLSKVLYVIFALTCMELGWKERLFFLPGALAGTWAPLDVPLLAAGDETGTSEGLATGTTTDSVIPLGWVAVRILVFKLSNSSSSFCLSSELCL